VAGDVWLIANPLAGGGRGARHASVVARTLQQAGLPCRLVQPSSAADSTAAARSAIRADARAVVACGGDGTVNAVLQAMVGSGVPMGMVAGGSGDDIAAGLGYPIHGAEAIAEAMVAALAGGEVRVLDVGAARSDDGVERFFLGVLSTGFDSSVNERANAMRRMAGHRYNIAIVRELASFRALDYDVVIDGIRERAPGMLVSVGNGSRYGGGMRICPDARSDDGLLDVTWLGAVSKPTFLRVFPSVFRGTHVEHPAVRTFRGRSIRIAAEGQIAYADGERIGPLPVEIEVRPSALRVLPC
jgi:diacylglycerol kinase (ATP)